MRQIGVSTIIRYILTAALLYGVYTETGIWTTLVLALLTIQNELSARLYFRVADKLKL